MRVQYPQAMPADVYLINEHCALGYNVRYKNNDILYYSIYMLCKRSALPRSVENE